jgi:hypothetical protein
MATVEDVQLLAERMGLNVKPNGRGFACFCPVHGDQHTRHLYVAKGDRVQVVFHCKHGCPEAEIVAAFGLIARDVGAPRPVEERGEWKAYQYLDEGLRHLYDSVRGPFHDGSKAKFRRPDPVNPGKFLWGLEDTRRVPYNLPELRQAKPNQIVVDVEGEPDVEMVCRAGLVGFTWPSGSGGWKEECLDFLPAGVRVVILRDYDRDGRKLAERKVAAYRKRAIPHVLLELPGLSDVDEHGHLKEKNGEDVSDWIRRRGHSHAELKELIETAFPRVEVQEWEAPIDLFAAELPPFPLDTLPVWLAAQVVGVSTATQTPVDLAAMLGLAALAIACQKRVEVWVRPDWCEPVSLWTVAALGSGEAKTPVFSHMVAPIVAYEVELTERMQSEVAINTNHREILEGRVKRLQQQAAREDSLFERQRITTEANDLAAELARTPVVADPRFLADDATPEKLALVMSEQGERMGIMADEAGVFEIMAGRYTQGRTNFTFYLKAHSGSMHIVDRIGRPSVMLRRPALSMGLTCQPTVLVRLSENPEFRERGLLARFLYSLPSSMVGHRDTDATPLARGIADTYERRLSALLTLPAGRDDAGRPAPNALLLSDAARDDFAAFRRHLEPELGDRGRLEAIGDWGGKLPGTLVRIAGLLHLAERAGELERPWEERIQADTLGAAISISQYLIEHALAAFRMIGSDPAIPAARKIVGWLQRQRKMRITLRELHQGMQGTFQTVEELDRPVSLLLRHQYLRTLPVDRKPGAGRPPSPVYEVNPGVANETVEK